jgi:PAP2 superfamily
MKLYLRILIFSLFFSACKKDDPSPVVPLKPNLDNPEVALQWAKMALIIAEKTPGNTPTSGSRSFGYIGLTMYESVVRGSDKHQSIFPQLTSVVTLTKTETGKEYNWILSLNAGQAYIIKNLYATMQASYKTKVDSLEQLILSKNSTNVAQDVIDRSVKYGQDIARDIFDWSKTDGGHEGYLRNFDPTYKWPTTSGSWVVPTFSQSGSKYPLHPTWGKNRPFVAADGQLPIPKPLPYSTEISSQYYAQFLEVYAKNRILTQEEKETAVWWSDDPSQTFTPPGHSYSIAAIAVKTANADLPKAAETFARVGMAIADAFINCWKCKYAYHVERPSSYVQANIDPSWKQFWPEPPFPAFSSGHSTQAAAAATVLTDLYGNSFKFVDNSHEGRVPDPLTFIVFKNRSFNSFWEAAEESAYSRFLGGIHTRHDNETGLIEGRKIGQNVNALIWEK